MSEARQRKLQQFGSDLFSPRPSGLGRRSYSLQDLSLIAPREASPCHNPISNSYKSTVFQPASPAEHKPNPFRPQDASTERLFGSDAPDYYKKQENELLPIPNFQPKEISETAWQVKSLDLFGAAHARTKSLEPWLPSNVGLSHNIAPTLAKERTIEERRMLQTVSNVMPLKARSRTPDVCHLFKWNDSRGEVRQNAGDMTARQRKSYESLSSVFGEPKVLQPIQQPALLPEPVTKAPPAIVRQKPREPLQQPMKRNVRAHQTVQRNCVPLTPKQMRDVMLRTPVVDCTPSKLLTLDLKGLSAYEDDFSIKQACQGFHVVSVQTKSDQIKGTCNGSARVQVRVHDNPESVKRLGLRLSEHGWNYQEPGSLGKKSMYFETSSHSFLDSNVEKEQLKASCRRVAPYENRASESARNAKASKGDSLVEFDQRYRTQMHTWERRRRSKSPVEKMFPLKALSVSFSSSSKRF